MTTWDIGLFGCGNYQSCLYSYFCCPCALSEAKYTLDGSQFLFNGVCVNCVIQRWLTRTAYDIDGSACGDLLTSCCCPCCSTNQIYQTTWNRGNPVREYAGYHNNLGMFQTSYGCTCSNCMYGTCCICCAMGTGMERAIGMPWWMGCLCVGPCAGHQLMRYQYRIRGSDIGGDLIAPSCLFYLAYALVPLTFGLSYAILFPYSVGKVVHLLGETEAHNGGQSAGSGRYLHDIGPSDDTVRRRNNSEVIPY
mmetsp:Transcript_25169/g.25374  ORF Transcript_25169/g.25374 Transcript_25169/m.25374 type:complete len:250 (+) Transcript_25169:78-827(+)